MAGVFFGSEYNEMKLDGTGEQMVKCQYNQFSRYEYCSFIINVYHIIKKDIHTQ